MKSKIEEAVSLNVERIQEMKDRIAHYELQNGDLAAQNEVFRKGAVECIMMSNNVDRINNDREKLSIDAADKAVVIRKLLEDNETLSR